MKKIIPLLAILFFITTSVLAVRVIEFNKIANLRIMIVLGEDARTPFSGQEEQYYPAVVEIQGNVMGENLSYGISEVLVLGNPRDTVYTPQEIYQFIKAKFGQEVADKLKNIYLQGINEDITID